MVNSVVDFSFLWIITEFYNLPKETDCWAIASSIGAIFSAIATVVICYFSWRDSSNWKKQNAVASHANLMSILSDYLLYIEYLEELVDESVDYDIKDRRRKLDDIHTTFIRYYNLFRIANYQLGEKEQKKFDAKFCKEIQKFKEKYFFYLKAENFFSSKEENENVISEFKKLFFTVFNLIVNWKI